MSEAKPKTIWRGSRKKLAADPRFGPLVERVGGVKVLVSTEPPFVYLVRGIVFQQLAGKAARTIHGRVVEALKGEVTPARVLRTSEKKLRGAGLSSNKLAALRDLATKVGSGEVVLDDLESLPDPEIIGRLTRVRGIGPWTAQMFLMFRLHRPDVWPAGDFGVRNGFAKLHGLDELPTEKELLPLGEKYRPWRSAAAWYCWRAVDIELPEVG